MSNVMMSFLTILIAIVSAVVPIYILILLSRALTIYIESNKPQAKMKAFVETLGGNIKYYRTENKMTQEFVAESLGVSRQSVSKWENGTNDPSTSNLIALAELFQVEVQQLIGGNK